MKFGILVNDVRGVRPESATALLGRRLAARGHEVSWLQVDQLSLGADNVPRAAGRPLGELDRLLIRSNPNRQPERAWAHAAALELCRMAEAQGLVVLNRPTGLQQARSKLYLQRFAEWVRPRTLITRSAQEVADFAEGLDGPVILKPLHGTGGASVFKLERGEHLNLNALVETLSANDLVIAQEYLPAAWEGDTRVLMLAGAPLEVDGKAAVVFRARQGRDLRSNVSKGGQARPGVLTDRIKALAAEVGPQLAADGIWLAGLDVIGDCIVEINTFAPGGLDDASSFAGVDFTAAVLDRLEEGA